MSFARTGQLIHSPILIFTWEMKQRLKNTDWERMKLIQTLKSNNRVQDKNNFSVWENESILECIFAYPIWSYQIQLYKICDMHFINRHIWEIHLHKEKSWYWYFQHLSRKNYGYIWTLFEAKLTHLILKMHYVFRWLPRI